MANKEQLAILKQGVAVWNKWREENPYAKIDLSWANLDKIDLSGANFSYADISGTNFQDSILLGTNFSKIKSKENIAFTKINFLSKILHASKYILAFYIISISVFMLKELLIEGITFCVAILLFIGSIYIIFIIATDRMKLTVNIKDDEYEYYLPNFNRSDLTNANFNSANMKHAMFNNAILKNTCFIYAVSIIDMECFRNTILDEYQVRMLLISGNGIGLDLRGFELYGAHLVNFDLQSIDLRETGLICANLSRADITGAKLWGSARENWIIDGIRCDYVYWDEAGEVRTPPDRNFRPGEFEELYKQLPSFEYVFAQGFTPLDPLIMDRVVQAINEQHKEFSLELVNFDKRGEPHATFTVCHLDYVDAAKKNVTAIYEKTIEHLMQENEYKKRLIDNLNNFIDQLIKKTPSIEDLKKMGDNYYISGGQIGAIGQHASASGNTFQQITVADISRLHEAMRNAAANPAQNAAADEVAKAEQAAKQQDEPKMRQHLKNAGKFAVDCVQKIGAEALSEYLKKMTLGL